MAARRWQQGDGGRSHQDTRRGTCGHGGARRGSSGGAIGVWLWAQAPTTNTSHIEAQLCAMVGTKEEHGVRVSCACVISFGNSCPPVPTTPPECKVMAISWTPCPPVPICAVSPPDFSCKGYARAEGEAHWQAARESMCCKQRNAPWVFGCLGKWQGRGCAVGLVPAPSSPATGRDPFFPDLFGQIAKKE